MSARMRKLVGLFAILAFLGAYVAAAVAIADRLPRSWSVQLLYFAVVGVAWGAPLLPLFRWMNRGR